MFQCELKEQIIELLPNTLAYSLVNAQLVLELISGITLDIKKFIDDQGDASDDRYSSACWIQKDHKEFGWLEEDFALQLAGNIAEFLINDEPSMVVYRKFLLENNHE